MSKEEDCLSGNLTGTAFPWCGASAENWTAEDYNVTYNCSSRNDVERVLYSPYFQAAIYFSYCSIFVAALCGNGLVCYVVHSSPRMRTVTNYFIANLAVGDVLMTLFCIPFPFVSVLILQHWPFGDTMCRIVSYSQAVSVLVSAYTLVAISLDRYMAIMRPLRPRLSKKGAAGAVVCVWVFALATAAPIPIVSRPTQPTEWHVKCSRYICEEEWPSPSHSYFYSMALMALQYFMPLSVLVVTYARIAEVVWGRRTPGEAENTRDQRMARSKRKMIKMMVTVVIVFTVCWLPFNILMVWISTIRYFLRIPFSRMSDPRYDQVLFVMLDNDYETLPFWDGLPYLWFVFHWLAMSHSCYNPIIYCWMNARFRVGFCCALSKVPCLRWLARRLAPGNTSGNSAFGGCTIGGATITHVGGGRSLVPRGRASTSTGPSTTSSFMLSKGNGRSGCSRPNSVLLGAPNSGQNRQICRRSLRNRDSGIDFEIDEASLLHRVDTGTSYVSVRRGTVNANRRSNGEGLHLSDSNGLGRDFPACGQVSHHYQRGRRDVQVEDEI